MYKCRLYKSCLYKGCLYKPAEGLSVQKTRDLMEDASPPGSLVFVLSTVLFFAAFWPQYYVRSIYFRSSYISGNTCTLRFSIPFTYAIRIP